MSSTEVGLTALIKLTAFAQPCRETNDNTLSLEMRREESGGNKGEKKRKREGETKNRKSGITHLLSSLVHYSLALTVYILGAFSINKCLQMRQSTAIESGLNLIYNQPI